MASACSRIAQRTSISSIKSAIKSNIRASSFSKPASSSSPLRQSLLTRFPFDFAGAEMRAVDVAAAQRGGGGENDVVSERDFQKLPSAFSGHIVNWEFAGPANYGLLLHYQMELMGRETCMLFLRWDLLSLLAWSISSKVTRREIEESLVFVRRLDL
ncbi:hypothetical protein HKD37_05G012399 [Glycine soja]